MVEDDPSVLDLKVEWLGILGIGGARVDAMFSDTVMPGGMNGVQLAVAARAIRDR